MATPMWSARLRRNSPLANYDEDNADEGTLRDPEETGETPGAPDEPEQVQEMPEMDLSVPEPAQEMPEVGLSEPEPTLPRRPLMPKPPAPPQPMAPPRAPQRPLDVSGPPPMPRAQPQQDAMRAALDADGQRSQQDAEDARRQSISDDILAAATRRPPPQRAASRAPMSAVERTQMLDKAAAGDTAKAKEAALSDPTSPESRRARDIVGSTPIGASMKQRLGDQWEKLPASALPGIDKLLSLHGDDPSLVAYRSAMVAKTNQGLLDAQNRDPQSAALLEAAAAAGVPEAYLRPLREAKGVPFETLLKAIQPMYERMKQHESFGHSEKLLGLGDFYDARKEDRAEKREAPKLEVTDASGAPAKAATVPEAEKLRAAKGEIDMMVGSTDRLLDLIRKHGIKTMPDNAKAEMAGLLSDLQLRAKGVANYNLGALSGSDMAMLEAVTSDPTRFSAYFKGGAEAAATQLRTMRSNLLRAYSTKVGAATRRAPAAPSGMSAEEAMKAMGL